MSQQNILTAGPAHEHAAGIILLVHGRGATAGGMIDLYEQLHEPAFAAVAPQATGNTWYPHSFMAPISANQPWLDASLQLLDNLVTALSAGRISGHRIVMLGFSQGACLTLEYAARHPRPYGAVIGLTGGLIGPPGELRKYPGSLADVPVFLGASDPDPHVPFERVQETQTVLAAMGAQVDLRRYPGMPHTINNEEMSACKQLLRRIAATAP